MHNTVRWIDFLPLATFVWISKLSGLIEPGSSLANAFYIGTASVLIQSIYRRYQALQLDFIALAWNLFILYGTLGYLVHIALLMPYEKLGVSAIFVWVILIGLVTTMVHKGGFIQGPSTESHKNLLGSLALLVLSVLAFTLSYCLVKCCGYSTSIGVVSPTIGLIGGRAIIRESLFNKTD